jgi:hypothetical protein
VRSGQSRRLDVWKPTNAAAETSWKVTMGPGYLYVVATLARQGLRGQEDSIRVCNETQVGEMEQCGWPKPISTSLGTRRQFNWRRHH